MDYLACFFKDIKLLLIGAYHHIQQELEPESEPFLKNPWCRSSFFFNSVEPELVSFKIFWAGAVPNKAGSKTLVQIDFIFYLNDHSVYSLWRTLLIMLSLRPSLCPSVCMDVLWHLGATSNYFFDVVPFLAERLSLLGVLLWPDAFVSFHKSIKSHALHTNCRISLVQSVQISYTNWWGEDYGKPCKKSYT